MKISVIIPIYNEESTIIQMQNMLDEIRKECEIIFVDGGSRDHTKEMIRPEYKLLCSEKGRANQMNYGAEHSTGDVLFFLHCDSKLPPNALEEIEEVMKHYRAGFFGISFPDSGILMKCCQVMSNFRARRRKIVFGDQGIFMQRDLFFDVGKFPEIDIMEDYMFSLRMRKLKIPMGMTKNPICTSDRRFSETNLGRLKTMIHMHFLRLAFRCGIPVEKIAEYYQDIR